MSLYSGLSSGSENEELEIMLLLLLLLDDDDDDEEEEEEDEDDDQDESRSLDDKTCTWKEWRLQDRLDLVRMNRTRYDP